MQRAAAVGLVIFAGNALAHPGHVVADLWHLLTEQDHLVMLVIPLVIAAATVFAKRHRNRGAKGTYRE